MQIPLPFPRFIDMSLPFIILCPLFGFYGTTGGLRFVVAIRHALVVKEAEIRDALIRNREE
jgi:hypothetical protein